MLGCPGPACYQADHVGQEGQWPFESRIEESFGIQQLT